MSLILRLTGLGIDTDNEQHYVSIAPVNTLNVPLPVAPPAPSSLDDDVAPAMAALGDRALTLIGEVGSLSVLALLSLNVLKDAVDNDSPNPRAAILRALLLPKHSSWAATVSASAAALAKPSRLNFKMCAKIFSVSDGFVIQMHGHISLHA
jgi:hypothetical protein